MKGGIGQENGVWMTKSWKKLPRKRWSGECGREKDKWINKANGENG